jgi:lipopolysaccharide export system protein LptA
VDIFFYKDRLYKVLFSLFFICIIDFSFLFSESSAAVDAAEADKIQVSADSLNINNEENYAEFIGSVKAVHKDMTINSDRLKIYYDQKSKNSETSSQNEGSIKKIIAEGNVIIVSDGRTANSQKAVYMTKNGMLILTGKDARITNKQNYITGSKIIFNRSSGNVKVIGKPDRRVKAIFFTKDQSSEFNILKSNKDDLNKTVVKDTSIKEAGSGTTAKQVAVADVISDGTPEEPSLEEAEDETLEKPTEVDKSDTQQAAALKVTEDSDKVEVEDLEVEDLEAALTAPGSEIKPSPQVSPEVLPEVLPEIFIGEIGEPVLVSEAVATEDLKNKIGVVFVEQKERIGGNDYNTVLNDYLIKSAANKIDDIMFLKLGKDKYPEFNDVFFNNKISPDILKQSRELGLNAIAIASIADIFTDKERKGILWFRNDYNMLIIRVFVDVYDTETGSKIFYESFTRTIDIDEEALEKLHSEKIIDHDLLTKQLRSMAKEAVSRLDDILTDQPWTGFVKATDKGKVIISSGKATGLKPGNLLEVYDTKKIKGYQGINYTLPDNKIGIIQVTEVSPETSQAVLVAGRKIEDGCLLKPSRPDDEK